jgi:hypothetical protein
LENAHQGFKRLEKSEKLKNIQDKHRAKTIRDQRDEKIAAAKTIIKGV